MYLRVISYKDVLFTKDHEKFFAGRYYATEGYYASNHHRNLGGIQCHNPWNTFVRDRKNEPLENTKFLTGYNPDEINDSMLFDKNGPYKRLYELSEDIQIVEYSDLKCGLLLPDEWMRDKSYHTLVYSFLIQTRDTIQYPYMTKNVKFFLENGFDVYSSYILSRCFDENLNKLKGWMGGHAIFNDGVNLTKYRNGSVNPTFNGNMCSQMWKGQTNPLRVANLEYYTMIGFGKPSICKDKEGLLKRLYEYMNVSIKREKLREEA